MEQVKNEKIESSEAIDLQLEEKISRKEILFRQFIEGRLFHSFSDELERFDYSKEQLEDFYRSFDSLNHSDKMALLAFPWELKQRSFPAFLEKVHKGMQMKEMVAKIIEASRSQTRAVAYHCSDQDILPREEKDGYGKKTLSWTVKGTEPDHRDDDVPMAYYSFDYYHLYREKNPKYLYIISIQKDLKSGHRKDNNHVWGRAPSLTIIDKIDLQEATDYITEKEKEYSVEDKKQAA